MDWNKIIAAHEYMKIAEVNTFKGDDFTLKLEKGRLILNAKT